MFPNTRAANELAALHNIIDGAMKEVADTLHEKRDKWLLQIINMAGGLERAADHYYIDHHMTSENPGREWTTTTEYIYRMRRRDTKEQFGPTFVLRITGGLNIECNF